MNQAQPESLPAAAPVNSFLLPAAESTPSPRNMQFADALMARVIALGQQGETTQAEQILRELLAQSPLCPPVLHNLAICLIQQDRLAEARQYLEQALQADSRYDRAHHTLGTLLHRQRQLALAQRHLRQAIALNASNAHALNDLGALLNDLKRFEEAEIYLSQAVRIAPKMPDAYNNLGVTLTSLGRLKQARRYLRKALELRPHDAAAQANLGNAYKEEGKLSEALACYDLSLAIAPDCVTTRWNRSLALLAAGDFEQGWTEYEWRWQRPQTPARRFTQPPWRGEPLHGRTILLYAEQGLGDTLQFVRYAAILKQKGAHVVLECPQPLTRLLQHVQGVDLLVTEGDALPAFDIQAPLMTLPRLCGTTVSTIPAPVPYIHVSASNATDWAGVMARAGNPDEFRVGIAWQGNPHHAWDRFRSVPLHRFARLGDLQGVIFFSLQTGPGTEQADPLSGSAKFLHLIQPSSMKAKESSITDMADIAAIIKNLDLVITVDTATAHLAGALGVEVWIMIAAISDWRWMRQTTKTPWYPTAQLFRQTRLGSWSPVFRDIRTELKHKLHQRHHQREEAVQWA